MPSLASIAEAHPHKPSTLSALKNPNFRLYAGGQLVSISGTWMQNLAQSYLVFYLTKSELWLGIVACAAGLPVLLMSPISGVIVERVPRRTLLIVTQTVQMLLAFSLAALTFTGVVQVWHIVVLAVLLGVTNSFDLPARQTFVVELVGREDLPSGIALNSTMNALGRVLGPTAAGVALVQFGAAWCFLINGVSFFAVLLSLFLLRVPYPIQPAGKEAPLNQLRAGFNFARRDPLVAPLILLASVAGLLILPFLQLLPAYADVVLHSPEEAYAALSAAEGIGAVIAGITAARLSGRFGHGKLIVAAVGMNAAAMILLMFQSAIPPSVGITGMFGFSMITLFVSLNTKLQMVVPDAFRGRVLSLYSLGLLGLSPFGALALGAFAEKFGVATAIGLSGALVLILAGAILLRYPILIHHDDANSLIAPLPLENTATGD